VSSGLAGTIRETTRQLAEALGVSSAFLGGPDVDEIPEEAVSSWAHHRRPGDLDLTSPGGLGGLGTAQGPIAVD